MKCLDTYALVEIANGNARFAPLITEEVMITDLTMAEFYGNLYKRFNQQTAEYWHKKLIFFCKSVPREILFKAVKFRIDHKKQNFSFFDCVGYCFARTHNVLFVTGDKEFQNLEGVEFVK